MMRVGCPPHVRSTPAQAMNRRVLHLGAARCSVVAGVSPGCASALLAGEGRLATRTRALDIAVDVVIASAADVNATGAGVAPTARMWPARTGALGMAPAGKAECATANVSGRAWPARCADAHTIATVEDSASKVHVGAILDGWGPTAPQMRAPHCTRGFHAAVMADATRRQKWAPRVRHTSM